MTEQAELERQGTRIQRELETVRRAKAELDREAQVRESEDIALRSAKGQADDEYRDLISRSSVDERLVALLAEIAQICAATASRTCPLCGAEYESSTALGEHIRMTAQTRSSLLESVEGALTRATEFGQKLDAIESARVLAENRSAESLRREEELLRELRRAGARLAEVGTVPALDDHTREGEEIRRRIAAYEKSIDENVARVNSIRMESGRTEARMGQVRAEMTALRARASSIREDWGSDEASQGLAVAFGRLQSAEGEHRGAVQALQRAEAEDRVLAGEVSGLDEVVFRLEENLAEARGREARDEERLSAIDSDVGSRLVESGIESLETSAESVRNLLRDCDERERIARRIAVDLEAVLAVEAQEERRARVAALEDRGRGIRVELESTARAKLRFDLISSAIRWRAEGEAREALSHQTGAIQECLTGLLPHRHLNRIVWDETTGAILVTDRLLTGAVRPDLYTSTGQMNSLALAVFLGVALLQRVTRWSFLALDEPVQNLDDVHFLAFLTLIKRVAGSRQIILSTADGNVAELIRRQLKSSWEKREYVEYEWRSFEAGRGPEVVKLGNRSVVAR